MSVKPSLTIFILLAIGVSLVSLIFFTFETLLIFGLIYLLSIPFSIFFYRRHEKHVKGHDNEDEHEDVL